ncbi:MAG: GNAT family N-acetyltransferase [Solobacterium sp.]|nr:GNAT family N-acetyltransferase [Solobacterium sp.]
MILTTERLVLRPWEDRDAESLYEYAKDERVGPAAGWPPHTDVENSRQIIRTVFAAEETYAVCRKEDGRAIGCVSLMRGSRSRLKLPETEGELGCWLGVPFWGQGIIPEALRELIRHAFRDLELQTLWYGWFDGNEKSARVQGKLGFSYDRAEPDVWWPLVNETHTHHFSKLTREAWLNGFQYRRCTSAESQAALQLAWEVFLEYESPDYSPEGTETFRRFLRDENSLSRIEYAGAFDGKQLIGMIGFRPSDRHICFFFVKGSYHRLGVGTRLFRAVLERYPGGPLTVNSSPYGLPFYKSLGFTEEDSEQTVHGIRFTPMILHM